MAVASNIGRTQLCGYLLEEVLAWMLRASGYDLITRANGEPDLLDAPHGLCVQGRGAQHQADVLGQLSYVPPFSMPLRMFVEAKWRESRGNAVGLEEMRNAHGVIHDVNQNWSVGAGDIARQRYHYLYAIFSTSGFSKPALQYAYAHQLVPIDLSAPAFDPLRSQVRKAGDAVVKAFEAGPTRAKPTDDNIPSVRRAMRFKLGTAQKDGTALPDLDPAIDTALQHLADFATNPRQVRLLLAFPSAPTVLALAVQHFEEAVERLTPYGVDAVPMYLALGQTSTSAATLTHHDFELALTLTVPVRDWVSPRPDARTDSGVLAPDSPLSKVTLIWSDHDGIARPITLRPALR